MEFKSYVQILRNKILFGWLPPVRPLVYLLYKINEKPIIVLGNQKAGTSAIAALLARAIGGSYDIDIGGFRNEQYEALHSGEIPLRKMIEKRAKIEFSKDVVKEPGLTYLLPQLLDAFPKADYVYIVRDPRANIRSTLNRLKIPGNIARIDDRAYPEITPIWRSILYNEWVENTDNDSHIYRSARRWRLGAEDYFKHRDRLHLIRYEDFNRDKKSAIEALAKRLGKSVVEDISGRVDVSYQPKGNNNKSYREFFGDDNLRLIESVCSPCMQKFNYQPELFLHEG